jgi:stage II sporulation protein AB (anti-sigma F factor)
MKTKINGFKLSFPAVSANEGFARSVCAAFISLADPTVEEINDIKTAVSEAVTNCIVHAYPDTAGTVYISGSIYSDGQARITVRDRGKGIEDIKKAREPLFTTGDGDRAGLGFSVMETFSDKVLVRSVFGKGTSVTLVKYIEGKRRDK